MGLKEFCLTIDEMFEWQNNHNELDKEGFVIKFENGTRIKIKSKRYFEVARIVANLSYKHLWEQMKNGKVNVKVIEQIPEEFRTEVNEIVFNLENKYIEIQSELKKDYDIAMSLVYPREFLKNSVVVITKDVRKKIGLNLDKFKHKNAVFSFIDNKYDKIERYITNKIYENLPKTNKREDLENN